MKEKSLVYGMRIVPSDQLKSLINGHAVLKNGKTNMVTLHIIEGTTEEEIKKQLFESIDAFFELQWQKD